MRSSLLVLSILMVSCTVGDVNEPGPGAPDDSGGSRSDGRYHPDGFAAADVHGPEMKFQAQDCRSCHGQDLAGTPTAPGCDGCHTPSEPKAWRSDCTFCHGGVDNDTGAPPRALDGTNVTPFPAHTTHLASTLMAAIDCTDCHTKPDNVLSEGHAFDDTAGASELTFTAGRSPAGTYLGPGSGACANLYCHGNGRGANGALSVADGPMTCGSCHADAGGDTRTMSGDHRRHIGRVGAGCQECHAATTADGASILDPSLHIDGKPDLVFAAAGMTAENVGGTIRCNGVCHGENHNNNNW